jgi:hypothetical protein
VGLTAMSDRLVPASEAAELLRGLVPSAWPDAQAWAEGATVATDHDAPLIARAPDLAYTVGLQAAEIERLRGVIVKAARDLVMSAVPTPDYVVNRIAGELDQALNPPHRARTSARGDDG